MKIFKFLIKLIVGIILIAVVSSAIFMLILAVQIKDSTDNTSAQIIENNVDLETCISTQVTEALSETATSGLINVSLDEYDLNEILYATSRVLAENFNNGAFEIRSMYVELTNKKYIINIPIKLCKIKTIVKGELVLTKGEDALNIKIKKISIGGVSIKSGSVSKVLSALHINKSITKKLEKYSIHATFNSDSVEINISKTDVADLLELCLGDSDEKNLITSLYDEFVIRDNCVELDISNPLLINLKMDLNAYSGSSSSNLENASINTKNYLISNGYNLNNARVLDKYYINGYEYLTTEEKTQVKTLLADEKSTAEIMAYEGLIERNDVTITSILASQVLVSIGDVSLKITESDVNNLLAKLSVVGTTITFASYRNCDVSYIVIEKIYTNISNNYLEIYLDLNINGYVITISLGLNSSPSSSATITGQLDYLQIGNVRLNEDNMAGLFKYLSTILEDDWITTDAASLTITFDFSKAFEDSLVLSHLLSENSNVTTSFEEKNNVGYINIDLRK